RDQRVDITDDASAVVHAWPGFRPRRNYANPTTGLQSKFSAEHALAVGLVDRAGGIAQFSDKRARDPEIIALRKRVTLEFGDDLGPFQVRVQVVTSDGATIEHRIDTQRGIFANPVYWSELAEKFCANEAVTVGRSRA